MDRMEIKKHFLNFLSGPYSYVHEGNEGFEDLSRETREFLIQYGISPQGDYGDYIHSIKMAASYETSFSQDDFMDDEINKIGFDKNIPMKSLDEEDKIIESLAENKDLLLFKRVPVNLSLIEQVVGNYEQLVDQWKKQISNMAWAYKTNVIGGVKTNGKNTILYDIMFRQRNEIWLGKFQKAHGNREYENIFLAGGLLHFIGPFNLLNMLQENGFSVLPVTCSNVKKEKDYLKALKLFFLNLINGY